MPVKIDVVPGLDRESAEKVAAELRAIAKQAVLDGIADALNGSLLLKALNEGRAVGDA